MSYYAKFTCEDLSRYLNKVVSVGLRKTYASARSAIWLYVLQSVYLFLPYLTATRTAGIDRNEEITSLTPYVYG